MEYEIEDFIGVFDGVFDAEFCSSCIEAFEHAESLGITQDRSIEGSKRKDKNDNRALLKKLNVKGVGHQYEEEFYDKFWNQVYAAYSDKYQEALSESTDPHSIYQVVLQRTKPSEGYHVWHYETGMRSQSSRLMAFLVYLNDVDEGGETEFLYIPKRVKPKAGRVVLFPSSYTHLHRGNPPLTNTKYVLTGWVEL